jgi:cell division protease FtsH
VSEETAHVIDQEIRSVIDRNYERAERLLRGNMEKMHRMADALMKYETIDRLQIDDIMEGKPPRPPENWEDCPPGSGEDGRDAPLEQAEDAADLGKPAELH